MLELPFDTARSVTGADIDIGFLSDQFKYSDQHRRRRNVL